MANASNVTYPPCVNSACTHTLCFMERRDHDECPTCGTPIPVELQLDQDFHPLITD